jgi:hypothetical protein
MRIDKDFDNLNAMELYFLYLEENKFIDALTDFAKNKGYPISEFICCGFPEEYESWEEGYFGKSGVKFEVEPPAVDDEKHLVVAKEDFVNFVSDLAKHYLLSNPNQQDEVCNLIKEISK